MASRASASWASKTFRAGRGNWSASPSRGEGTEADVAGVVTEATRVAVMGLSDDFQAGPAVSFLIASEPVGRAGSGTWLSSRARSARQTSVPMTKTTSTESRPGRDFRFRRADLYTVKRCTG